MRKYGIFPTALLGLHRKHEHMKHELVNVAIDLLKDLKSQGLTTTLERIGSSKISETLPLLDPIAGLETDTAGKGEVAVGGTGVGTATGAVAGAIAAEDGVVATAATSSNEPAANAAANGTKSKPSSPSKTTKDSDAKATVNDVVVEDPMVIIQRALLCFHYHPYYYNDIINKITVNIFHILYIR